MYLFNKTVAVQNMPRLGMKKGELDTKLNRYKVHFGDVVSLIGETHRNINKNAEVAKIKSGNLTKT